ncbi:peptidoglycan-binding protein [Phytohabitans flavus]|nr:peptidoglycan-binding domain-containing protein [Phytohabitans flavus]
MVMVDAEAGPRIEDVLAAAVKTLPEAARRWPEGPICLAREYKAYRPDLPTYSRWVEEVERRIADTDELVQRLRLLHYGRAAGNVLFDIVLDSKLNRMGAPMTLAHAGQATLDGLIGTGKLTTFVTDSAGTWRPPVDISHLWVLADYVRNGLGAGGYALAATADPVGALSWTGDLASWWSSYNDQRLTARAAAVEAGQEWQEPTDPAALATPLQWLHRSTTWRCGVDDLFGDMDAIALMGALAEPGQGATPVTDLLRVYYGPSPVQVGRALLHADNRFHLFVRHAQPAIPHTVDEETGVVTVDRAEALPVIRGHIRDVAMAILRITRLRIAGRERGIIGLLDQTGNVLRGLRVEASVREDVDGPWGAAMLDEVAARFTDFLLNGLAGEGWDVGAWPQDASPLEPYGGFLLQYGDSDAARRYGGKNGAVPAVMQYVRTLQEHLEELGFTSGVTPDGQFGASTAMALRELQIEAQQSRVWQEKGAPVPGMAVETAARRFRGYVNGCLDPETAATIAEWRRPAGGLRNLCPVRVYTRRVNDGVPGAVVHTDVWRWDQVKETNVRFYAADGLARYPIPRQRIVDGDPTVAVVGAFSEAETTGPNLGKVHSWPEAAITTRTLVPAGLLPAPPADPAGLPIGSTYRVVRAIAHVECQGNFDIINAYDRGRVSIGVCHWALMTTGIGEYAALLAYYAHIDPEAYQRDFGRYGILPEKPWDPATWTADGAGAQAKYAGRLAFYGLRDGTGRLHPAEPLPLGAKKVEDIADAYLIDYLRGWHALHRLAMGLRTNESMWRLMWTFTLFRLRALLARPFHSGPAAGPGPVVPDGAGGQRVATFGEVFTSERAVTALLRWHVNRPGRVLDSNGAVNDALAAFQTVYGTGRVNLAALTQAQQDAAQVALAQDMIDRAPTDSNYRDSVRNAVTYVDAEVGALRSTARSFQLIPEAPMWPRSARLSAVYPLSNGRR